MKTVIVIGGPTASGKSGLAVSLAQRHDGVVINADSMQIYKGLPLLSAQPAPEDTATVPHSLYETMDASETCSAAKWRDLALDEIENALRDNRLPIVVGGTGFYIKTLLKGISPLPAISSEVRARLNAQHSEIGSEAFYALLLQRDPVMAARLHPSNTQRLIRALEVLEGTGKSLAEWQELPPVPPPAHLKFITAVLIPERAKLYAACNGRFGAMIEQGALDEVKVLRARVESGEVPADAQLTHALGYSDLCDYMDGTITHAEAITSATQATRNYAKRQMTWFRNQITADVTLDRPDLARLTASL